MSSPLKEAIKNSDYNLARTIISDGNIDIKNDLISARSPFGYGTECQE